MDDRLKVRYVSVLWGTIGRWERILQNHLQDKVSYPWMTGQEPELFRYALVTPLSYPEFMEDIVGEQQVRRKRGEMDFLMFDSGGFQTLRDPSFTMDRLIQKDYELYTQYEIADAYVLPDKPTRPQESLEVMEGNVMVSVTAAHKLYDKLPDTIQMKSVPVYHARKKEHIDLQFEHYKDITSKSKMLCYSIAGLNKKFNAKHMEIVLYLKSLQPDCSVHLLGIGAPPALFCMEKVGVNTFDTLTPHRIATLGRIATFYGSMIYSIRLDESVEDFAVEEMKEQTGHRCPFCDDLKRLKRETNYRSLHNWIVYEELSYFYKQFNMQTYKEYAPKWHKQLRSVLSPDKVGVRSLRQGTLFEV